MRAMMSLPVPLSPWIRTGTLAAATLSMRSRSVCMMSDLPKTMDSGGISPIDCTSELTEFVVVMVTAGPTRVLSLACAPGTPNPGACAGGAATSMYAIDLMPAIPISRFYRPSAAGGAWREMWGRRGGKKFSHCRSKFPSHGKRLGDAVQQRPREFEADQVVALGVSHSQAACAEGAD